ncbi:MAG: YajQ family cyclic di-GMP-binding protein [Candidatus Eremiobacter antarcticus]|nr:YajQ family cyclic di-GMP-binding protein [Candidatus Eremiobacteraeota bacterium]MBC5807796.1 YajQ family cyclic di-GMP-binding protein [Candidatus Eremiobacteraeota bacterium]PZR60772.1 MAG: YajQ family cyclic di-GMP-binding protein [Candidatus Eremiobacter sp. RRmetagenome_bin22]
MSDFSFDIVSRVDRQNLADAVNQTEREIATRFDLKNSKSSIELAGLEVTVLADDELKRKNVVDILQSKCVKRGVPLKALQYGKPEPAAGGTVRQVITCAQGIAKDKAKTITEAIKSAKLKANTQIQDEQIRVSSKSKDELQKAITLVQELPLEFPVQFVNYR